MTRRLSSLAFAQGYEGRQVGLRRANDTKYLAAQQINKQ